MNLLVRFTNQKLKPEAMLIALASCLLFMASGCGIPQLRGAFAGRDLPPDFNGQFSPDNSSIVGIDEFFGDPVLTNLIDEGLGGNQELKILAEDIQIANNEVLRRSGAYLPFIWFGGRAGVEKPSLFTPAGAVDDQLTFPGGGNFPTPLPNFLVATNLSWQIDIWRQLRNSRDAATLRYLGSCDGRNYVVTRLVAEIAENYYGLIALDKRIENLDRTIALQEQSLEMSKALKAGARANELAVQRFQAEVRKNQSEKLIIKQEIIEVENRINFLSGRYPQPVSRSEEFFDLNLHALGLGVPAELLQNRPDIRKAERELEAAGLEVSVARANFYPKLNISAGVGYEAFNARYLITSPESLVYNVMGDLVVPLINRRAIKAEYQNANAKQLQACYDYQRTVLNAFTEVVNRVTKVQNYSESIVLKRQQLVALEDAVVNATKLFQNARVEYIDVLLVQRDLMDARMVLIDTKRQQLAAIVNTYQALGGGLAPLQLQSGNFVPVDEELPSPTGPTVDEPAAPTETPATPPADGAPTKEGADLP